MHDPNPHKLTEEEWREVGKLVGESWGLEDNQDPAELRTLAYGARFNFVPNVAPGYGGPLYIIGGDSIAEPYVLIRGKDGNLLIAD